MATIKELGKAQTRTEATQMAYLSAGIRHAVRAGAIQGLDLNFELLVRSLEAEDGTLRPATVRRYKAEVSVMIEVWGQRAGLGHEQIADLTSRACASLTARSGTPNERRTASKKVKNASSVEIQKVLDDLRKRARTDAADLVDQLLPAFIEALAKTGARPIELLRASLKADYLLLPSAKATNGRGCAPIRPVALSPFGDDFRLEIERLMPRLRLLSAESRLAKRDDRGALKLLAARLARSCARTRTRRLALYSFRHAALAAWKHMGFSPAEIAALAGQASIHTASRHYSRSRNGLERGEVPIPDPELVAVIQARHRRGDTPPRSESTDSSITAMADLPGELSSPAEGDNDPVMPAGWTFEPFPTAPAKQQDAHELAVGVESTRIARERIERFISEVEASVLRIQRTKGSVLFESTAKQERIQRPPEDVPWKA